ncbi:hypothetical protein D1872_81410 [compost metagenome]
MKTKEYTIDYYFGTLVSPSATVTVDIEFNATERQITRAGVVKMGLDPDKINYVAKIRSEVTNIQDQIPPAFKRIEKNFSYHPPKEGQPEKYEIIRRAAKDLAVIIATHTPECFEQRESLKNIEQAVFWANAAEARNG